MFQEMPEDVDFASLRDMLAVEGGKLLVTTLRNMLAGQVSWQWLHSIFLKCRPLRLNLLLKPVRNMRCLLLSLRLVIR